MSKAPAAGSRPMSWIEKHWFGARFGDLHRLLPGTALAAAVVVVGTAAARYGGEALLRAQGIDPAGPQAKNPLSPMMASIVVGLALGNLLRIPAVCGAGLDFCTKRLLRLGIVLIGLKLSLFDLGRLGAGALPAVAGTVAVGLVVVPWIARALGLGDALGALAAASTSICGVTAALAVAPTVKADERETACTVANVTLFGLLAMFVHPWIAHAFFDGSPGAAGLFLGTAVHDTSQVTGAATVYAQLFGAPRAADAAVVTKLARNLCLVGVVPYLAWRHAKRTGGAAGGTKFAALVPLFVGGFVLMTLVRTLGDRGVAEAGGRAFGFVDAAAWKSFVHAAGETWAVRCLAAAMAAVGLSTSFAKLRSLGPRPFVLGGLAALVVSGTGLLAAFLCGRFVG